MGARFEELGFALLATRGTAAFLAPHGIRAEVVDKVSEGRPNVVGRMVNGDIQLAINTASGSRARKDGIAIRRGSLEHGVPYVAAVPGAFATAEAIAAVRRGELSVRPLQSWQARAVSSLSSGK